MRLTIEINEDDGRWVAETLENPGIVGHSDTPRGAINQLLDTLEDMADEAVWDDLFARSPHVLDRLAEEAEIEIKAGRTTELDPDLM